MRKMFFAVAAVFIFLFLAGCTQNGTLPPDIAKQKQLCEATGGTFTYCEPGAVCKVGTGCQCPEGQQFDSMLGCMHLQDAKTKIICENSGGRYNYCKEQACISGCICNPGQKFDAQLGCTAKSANTTVAVNQTIAPAPNQPSTLPNRIWYFAFGSNLNFKGMQGRVGYWPEVRKAILPNYLRTFAGAGDIRQNSSSLVYGAIYLLNETQMQALDRYEGVASGNYRRINVTVVALGNQSNEMLPAVAYQFVTPRPFSPPSEGYLNTIIEGMHDNGYGDYEIGLLLKEARKSAATPNKTKSDSYWRGEARPFSILEHTANSSTITLVVQNVEFDVLTIRGISIGSVPCLPGTLQSPPETSYTPCYGGRGASCPSLLLINGAYLNITSLEFAGGARKVMRCSTDICQALVRGSTYAADISISYDSQELNNQIQKGSERLVGECTG
jgi:hypothetical protein